MRIIIIPYEEVGNRGERFFSACAGREKGPGHRALSQKGPGLCKKLKPRAWKGLFQPIERFFCGFEAGEELGAR
jgi:hypothetical protein